MIRYTNFINEKKGDYWNELFIKSTHLNDLDILFDFIKNENSIYKNAIYYMYMSYGSYYLVFLYVKKPFRFRITSRVYDNIKNQNITPYEKLIQLNNHIEKYLNINIPKDYDPGEYLDYKRIEKNFEMLEK